MITINLLPQEYRRKERTPLRVFLPIIIGLVCVLSAGAVAAYVHFGRLTETVNDRKMWEARLQEKQPQLRYEEALLAEESEYKKRSDTIRKIATSRMLMTKKLDEICDIIAAGYDSGQYMVWLQDFRVKPPKGTRRRGAKGPAVGATITMKGYALADRDPLQSYNRAHAAFKNSRLVMEEGISMSKPAGKIQEFQDDKTPGKGWTMDLAIQFADPAALKQGKHLAKKLKPQLKRRR